MALTDPHAVQLIDEVVQGNKRLLLGVVRPLGGTEPPEGAVMHARADELYEVGTLGTVVRMLKLGDGSVRVMVQGLERARLVEVIPAEHWLGGGRSGEGRGGEEGRFRGGADHLKKKKNKKNGRQTVIKVMLVVSIKRRALHNVKVQKHIRY